MAAKRLNVELVAAVVPFFIASFVFLLNVLNGGSLRRVEYESKGNPDSETGATQSSFTASRFGYRTDCCWHHKHQ